MSSCAKHVAIRRRDAGLSLAWLWPEVRAVVRRGELAMHLALATLVVGAFVGYAHHATGHALVAPLDDTYIHLQYARSIAEGHPFRYFVGEPRSSGATSPLYVLLLALPYALGLRGAHALIGTWAVGVLSLAASGHFMERLVRVRTGVLGVRLVSLAVVYGSGWLGFHAASGMEGTITTAVSIASCALALEWGGAPREARSGARLAVLVALAWAGPLLRPTSCALSCALAVLLLLRPPRRRRALALLALPSAFAGALFWKLVVGSWTPNGARAKWLFAFPHLSREQTWEITGHDAASLARFLAGIGDVERGYLPLGVAGLAMVVGLSVALAPRRLRAFPEEALFAWSLLAALLALTTFQTFAGHKFRYLFPYVIPLLGFGLRGVHALGARLDHARPRARLAAAHMLPALVAGAMLTTWAMPLTVYAGAVHEIAAQHLAMAERVRMLPPSARVAVTDTGALAYFGGHRTLDLVGLTTNGGATAYIEGAGSQFEYIESLPRALRPTHVVTYDANGWWHPTVYLGARLEHYAVTDPIYIVGGPDLGLWETRYPPDGADAPPPGCALVDQIDVGDLEDERAHGYALTRASDASDQTILRTYTTRDRGTVSDGGRIVHDAEVFRIRGRPGRPLRLIARTDAWFETDLETSVGGRYTGTTHVGRAQTWTTVSILVPGRLVRASNSVRVHRRRDDVAVFHWWACAG